jgi:hypothetical protein
MSRTVSPFTKQPYGVTRVAKVWNLARSSFYAHLQRTPNPRPALKRGPKVLSDSELLMAIRQRIEDLIFTGEEHRKIWARLRFAGIRTSKERVLRLMRENNLLSPSRWPEPGATNPHEGTIVATAPDRMWGTDATGTMTA